MDAGDEAGAIAAVVDPAGVGGAPARPKRGQMSVGTEHGDWFRHGNRRLCGDAEQSCRRGEHHGKGERSCQRRTSPLFLAHIHAQRHADPPCQRALATPRPVLRILGPARTGDESDRPTSLSRLPERGVRDRATKLRLRATSRSPRGGCGCLTRTKHRLGHGRETKMLLPGLVLFGAPRQIPGAVDRPKEINCLYRCTALLVVASSC